MARLVLGWVLIVAASSATACGGNDICDGDDCVCPANESCAHDCTNGGTACNVQCGPGTSCDVGCASGENCNVECSSGASCQVDCNGAPSCDVTCPANNCTVSNCPAANCDVTCGNVGLPTRNGNTATCP